MNIFLLFLAVILQLAVIGHFKVFGVMPNLVLIILIFDASRGEKQKSFFKDKKGVGYFLSDNALFLFYVLLAGLILDIFSGLPFGVIVLSLFFTVLSIYALFRGILGNLNLFYIIILFFMATIFYYVWLFIFMKFFQINLLLAINILKEAAINIILAIIFYVVERSRKILY